MCRHAGIYVSYPPVTVLANIRSKTVSAVRARLTLYRLKPFLIRIWLFPFFFLVSHVYRIDRSYGFIILNCDLAAIASIYAGQTA